MKTIILTIGDMTFAIASLKKANAIIEAIHTADLKLFITRYNNLTPYDYSKTNQWVDMTGFDLKVEIKENFEIVDKPKTQLTEVKIEECCASAEAAIKAEAEDDDEECPF